MIRKRSRGSSPPPSELEDSYNGLLFDRQPSAKRRRFINRDVDPGAELNHTPIPPATTNAAELNIAGARANDDDPYRDVRENIEDDGDSEADAELALQDLHITPKPPSRGVTPTAHRIKISVSPTPSVSNSESKSSSSSTYTPINSILSKLNDIRMQKTQQHSSSRPHSPAVVPGNSQSLMKDLPTASLSSEHSRGPPSGPSMSGPAVPVTRGRTPPRTPDALLKGYSSPKRALSNMAPRLLPPHHHSPAVSSPLRQSIISRSDSSGSLSTDTLVLPSPSAAEQDEAEKESEAVRTRYEDINRLLGSLALSRRRAQSNLEEDAEDT
ncbi:hypothetical protein FRB94_001210 [Tulasnella sp. JGI-2019a]|nr:hypothetical protein FRB93_010590 [Tulasnella sp. JGI-2019a]KAG9005798.1 hypothetical protein FRB94_001210 [Tulasnella sp. JGI-2019a]